MAAPRKAEPLVLHTEIHELLISKQGSACRQISGLVGLKLQVPVIAALSFTAVMAGRSLAAVPDRVKHRLDTRP